MTVTRLRPQHVLDVVARRMLFDFDALLERALVAAEEGRERAAAVLVEEAGLVARSIFSQSVCPHVPNHAELEAWWRGRGQGELAAAMLAAAAHSGVGKAAAAQHLALKAKRLLMRGIGGCACQALTDSRSGRPLRALPPPEAEPPSLSPPSDSRIVRNTAPPLENLPATPPVGRGGSTVTPQGS